MSKLTTVLLKQKTLLILNTRKRPNLFDKRQRLSGKILSVLFNRNATIFDVSDFVKVSKKQRSNITDVQIKDIFQYNFIGICIAHRKDPFILNTSFLIRNVFDRVPYELYANLYSPIIDYIYQENLLKISVLTHAKYYYLRHKPCPASTIEFDYVIDSFEDTEEEPEEDLYDTEEEPDDTEDDSYHDIEDQVFLDGGILTYEI